MGTWIDHLSSVLIAGAVTVLLASVWSRDQAATASATGAYQSRVRVEALRRVIDGDMAHLGAGVDAAEEAVLGLSWSGGTRSFEFRSRVGDASAPEQVRYLATPTPCSAGGASCWRFRRQVHDGSQYRDAGFDVEAADVSIALLPAGPPSAATAATIRLTLPASTRPPAPAVSVDRYYRLVNQEIRQNSSSSASSSRG